jgi:N-acyl-D-aspartate/D-glutamate deacylase
MHELVIRGGTVVDGTGAPSVTADVAVDGGRITAVGQVDERGERELDADGLVVAPGWVDIHTHYDGQVTWDPEVTPSSWHGVTTVVMGNCGVGFAPVRPGAESFLIELMEGVEDIPGTRPCCERWRIVRLVLMPQAPARRPSSASFDISPISSALASRSWARSPIT